MRNHDIVQLSDDELEIVSGSDKAYVNWMQTLSTCLKQLHDVNKAILANVRA